MTFKEGYNLKEKLNLLLEIYQSQLVGKGYFDVIVKRDKYRMLAGEILKLGFSINAVSWWEYVDSLDKGSEHGIGGPSSKYLKGWYSELIIDIDDINFNDTFENQLKEITEVINNKEIKFPGEKVITFKEDYFLTPGFWLVKPEGWEEMIDVNTRKF